MSAPKEACVSCLRPVVSREEWDARGERYRLLPDRCYVQWAAWDPCRSIALKLRAAADATILADARCLPPGLLAAVAAVLREGATAKGCAPHESVGGQTMAEHLEHAFDHVGGARSVEQCHGAAEVDPDDLTHAIARLALVWSLR